MKFYTYGEGFPLVLIHGFPFDHTIWDAVIPVITKESFRIISVDLPGISPTALPYEPQLTMQGMAAELSDYLEMAGIERCFIAGHSMGGYLALECLSALPQRIQGISLVHSLAAADDDSKKAHRQKTIDLILKGEDEKKAFIRQMVPQLFSDKKKHSGVISDIVNRAIDIPYTNIASLYHSILSRKDHMPTISGTGVPIQWIVGQDDNATPMAAALAQCHLADTNFVHLMKDTGHMSMYEDAAALSRYLLYFLKLNLE